MKVFSHQAGVYDGLLSRARAFFEGHWKRLPIRTRWHSLIVGPTGCGKTALGTMLAAEIGAELLRIAATSWMPSGAHNRAVSETLSIVIEHIHRHPKTILFLDEIDKLWHDTSWNSYVRGELFDLLDGRFPVGAKGIGDGSSLQVDDEGTLTLTQRTSLGEKLCSSVFVIAAGTFQDFYDAQSQSVQIGFHKNVYRPVQSCGPTADFIAKKLPRELVNRFNSGLLLLPHLEPAHYQLIAEQAEQSLPAWLAPAFRQAAARRVDQAIASQSGCRFVEDALVDALQCTPPPQQIEDEDPFAAFDECGFDFEP